MGHSALLVRYFIQKFARRMNKTVETIPAEVMTRNRIVGLARECQGIGKLYRAIGNSV